MSSARLLQLPQYSMRYDIPIDTGSNIRLLRAFINTGLWNPSGCSNKRTNANNVFQLISPECPKYASVNWVSISSANGLTPRRHKANFWTNAGTLLIWPLEKNISDILIKIHIFAFKKVYLKISSVKWRPFCFGLSLFNTYLLIKYGLYTVSLSVVYDICRTFEQFPIAICQGTVSNIIICFIRMFNNSQNVSGLRHELQ